MRIAVESCRGFGCEWLVRACEKTGTGTSPDAALPRFLCIGPEPVPIFSQALRGGPAGISSYVNFRRTHSRPASDEMHRTGCSSGTRSRSVCADSVPVGGASVTEPDLQTMTCTHLCLSYTYNEPQLASPYSLSAFADPKPARKAVPSRKAVNPNLIRYRWRNSPLPQLVSRLGTGTQI